VRSPHPVPTTWLPTTGEEYRPAAQKRSPDESTPYFRSRASFQPTWLPQWDGGERPKPVVPDASGEAFAFKPVTATVPISGIAWYTPSEDKERPVPHWPTPGNNFFSVQVPTATVPVSGMAWYVTQEQMRPPAPPDQYYVTWTARIPPAVVSTVSGIAWFNPSETRLPPAKGDPYVVQTLPPFIAPPLQSFYAAANADDFNPLKVIQQVDARPTWVARSFAASVGVSGIAWWRQAEVYREPPPLYRDYHPAWTPILVAGQFRVLWAIPLNKTTGGSSS
jgi:hypothetical protein